MVRWSVSIHADWRDQRELCHSSLHEFAKLDVARHQQLSKRFPQHYHQCPEQPKLLPGSSRSLLSALLARLEPVTQQILAVGYDANQVRTNTETYSDIYESNPHRWAHPAHVPGHRQQFLWPTTHNQPARSSGHRSRHDRNLPGGG